MTRLSALRAAKLALLALGLTHCQRNQGEVEGNDKRRARLNCIAHLLKQIPYQEVPQAEVQLPERVFNPDYERHALPADLFVPQVYG